MPSSYAHYRFGKQVLPTLPPEARQCVTRFRRMFDLGTQGPDFFFYFNPVMSTAIGSLGSHFHTQSGQIFFPKACQAASSEAAQAYLYGLLCHYCLDSACHPFVEAKDSSGEAGHVALESEFDRYLLAMDGVESPHTFHLGPKLKLTRGECMTVAQFYPPATGANVFQAVRIMAFALKFLASKNRKRIRRILSVKPSLQDSLIPEEPVEAFARMDSELLARFNRAVKGYPAMLAQLQAHMATGEALGEDFAPPFGNT